MEKFIVYGHGRTGTSNLIRLIAAHPDAGDIGGEIWRVEKHWGDLIRREDKISTKDFKRRFSQSFKSLDGHKILSKQLNEDMRKHALASSLCKVVLSIRRNLLKAAVSRELLKQSGICQPQDQKSLVVGYDSLTFDAITDFKNMAYTLNTRKRMAWARDVLKDAGKVPFEVVYEDFYLLPTLEDKLEKLKELYAFLGLSPVIDKKARKILDYKPLNNPRIYLKVPNIYEIEKKFGSDETGWLFDGYGGLI